MDGRVVWICDGVCIKFARTSTELKWVVFTDGKRGSVGKLVAQVNDANKVWIKSISLKPSLRGNDLGLTMIALCKAYTKRELHSELMELEAEEDMCRTGRLVAFYERAAFTISSENTNYKIMYNGDETYRVVPMKCLLKHSKVPNDNFNHKNAVPDLVEETLQHTRHKMSVWDAILVAGDVEGIVRRVNIMAEKQHPSWMQFLALVQHLGCIRRILRWSSGDQFDEEEKEESDNIDGAVVFEKHTAQVKWSDDAYLSLIMKRNNFRLPQAAFDIIRYRSRNISTQDEMSHEDQTRANWISQFSSICGDRTVDDMPSISEGYEQQMKAAQQLTQKFAPGIISW